MAWSGFTLLAISRYPPCGNDSFLTNFILSKLHEITITGLDPCHLGACILRKYRPIELSVKMEKHTPLPYILFSVSSLYIVPLLSPGTITGLYIYSGENDSTILYAMKGEVSPGRGFSSGALHAENGARRCFGGSFLKYYVNCFLPLKKNGPRGQ